VGGPIRAIEFLDSASADATSAMQPLYLKGRHPIRHTVHPATDVGADVDDAPSRRRTAWRARDESKPGPEKLGRTGEPFPVGGSARFNPQMTDRDLQLSGAARLTMVALIDTASGRVMTKLRELKTGRHTMCVFHRRHGDSWAINGLYTKAKSHGRHV